MVDTPVGATGAAPVVPTPLQQAEAAYEAALAAAAAPDPKAKELRDTAMNLLQQANALDGPARLQARQKLGQFRQMRQRMSAMATRQPALPARSGT